MPLVGVRAVCVVVIPGGKLPPTRSSKHREVGECKPLSSIYLFLSNPCTFQVFCRLLSYGASCHFFVCSERCSVLWQIRERVFSVATAVNRRPSSQGAQQP